MDKREEYIERMRTLVGDYINAIRDYDPAKEESLQKMLDLVGKINKETYSVFEALGIEFEPDPEYKDEDSSLLDKLLEASSSPYSEEDR